MTITRDVIAQAITLASIIAGFSFAITAQIALGHEHAVHGHSLTKSFATAGLCCVAAVITGLFYLMATDEVLAGLLALALIILLARALACFVAGGAQLAALHAQSKAGSYLFLREVAIILYLLHKEYGWFADVM